MVLYGIWIIDSASGLPLAYTTTPGFKINPDLFSGFITASHDFAHAVSGGKLETIALGTFKMLIRRSPLTLKVIAVGPNDPDIRYTRFLQDIEEKVSPILVPLHQRPGGLSGIPSSLRKQLQDVISKELEAFSTRKAPSDLSELSILGEESARILIRTLLDKQGCQLVPEPSNSEECYSYPLASSITRLSDLETTRLLDLLAEFGILLTEAVDTSLSCPNCHSLNLHPRILCPSCKTPAQPVALYEHLTCGHIGVRPQEDEKISCSICPDAKYSDQEFRLFRGFQCSHCDSFFKTPSLIFICHRCRTNIDPEKATVKVLLKYILNPALIFELESLLVSVKPAKIAVTKITSKTRSGIVSRLKGKITSSPEEVSSSEPVVPSLSPISEEAAGEQAIDSTQELEQSEEEIAPEASAPSALGGDDEASIVHELEELEKSFALNKISEAEYDRQFVRLRLQLRILHTHPTNNK
ncbi:MAG: hypothetical protein ACFFDP_00540 [Promethearchaeota archaeon]